MGRLRPEQIPEHVRVALRDYEARLRGEFGDRVRKVALFGSWARGEQHRDSDIDVLVLIEGADWREEREAAAISADTGAATDVWLSPAIYSTERMRRLLETESPFARHVASEEVVVT